MERPKLDRMSTSARIKYLKDTDHLVVKWVNHYVRPDGRILYHRERLPHITTRLSEATLYDMKYFATKLVDFTLVSVTRKQIFEARLKET